MSQIVFKVVFVDWKDVYESSHITRDKLVYEIGKKTTPNILNSKIFVYPNFDLAIKFCDTQRYVVLACECEGFASQRYEANEYYDIKNWWDRGAKYEGNFTRYSTFTCSSLAPIAAIDVSEIVKDRIGFGEKCWGCDCDNEDPCRICGYCEECCNCHWCEECGRAVEMNNNFWQWCGEGCDWLCIFCCEGHDE